MKLSLKSAGIIINLRTRNPGLYVIRGYVSYRDKATGKTGKSNTVSFNSFTADTPAAVLD